MTDRFQTLRAAAEGLDIHKGDTLGVAVSGGSDSLGLLYLLHEAGWPLAVATVNHGLRVEAADEAAFVASVCTNLGVQHRTLSVDLSDAGGNLQDQARRARYAALSNWAEQNALQSVALGHTLDDQAETFLMRLARGAGIDGLHPLDARFEKNGSVFLRPLITVRRGDIRGYLRDKGIGWIDDPSNDDLRFDRVKARRILDALTPLGVTVESLAMSMDNIGQARSALQSVAYDLAVKASRESDGDLLLDRDAIAAAPEETQRRILVGALRFVSGADYPPRRDALAEIQRAAKEARQITLGGCLMSHDTEHMRVAREYNAVRHVTCPTDQLWDGRWRLHGPHDNRFQVRALGEAVKDTEWRETGRPRQSLLASPSVWRGDTLVAAPLAGLPNGWTAAATGRGNFADFLIRR